MSRGRGVLLIAVLALIALSTATAATRRAGATSDDTPCCSVVLSDLHLPSTYSILLATTLMPPAAYAQTAPGTWTGPQYRLAKTNAIVRASTITWSVRLDHTSGTADAAARAFTASPNTYNQVRSSGPVDVPHIVDGRQVGTITGFTTVLQPPGATVNAQYQGLLAFPLGKPTPDTQSASRDQYFVVLRFLIRQPASDRYVVGESSTPAPAWNAAQLDAALKTVQVVGSMPPAQLTTTVRRVGSPCCRAVVRGSVKDSLGQPVAHAKVLLLRALPQTPAQKRHHSKVRYAILFDTKTASDGTYSLRVAKKAPPGSYRVSVQLARSVVVRDLVKGSA